MKIKYFVIKKSVIFLLLNLYSNNGFTQTVNNNYPTFLVNVGLAFGSETVMSIPKVNFIAEFGNSRKATYLEASGAIWFFFAGWGSLSLAGGYRSKQLTFDTSIAAWKYKP